MENLLNMKKILLVILGAIIAAFITWSAMAQSTNVPKTVTASGTNTYSITESLPAAYDPLEKFLVRFTNGNTTAVTLNRAGLGAKAIKKNKSAALVSGDILAGQTHLLAYDGTNYECISCGSNDLSIYMTKAANLSDVVSPSQSRTNLGGTTVGSNLFTATSPSAVTFPKIAANNTVSFRTLSQTLNDILPNQSGNSGKILKTDGSATSWQTSGGYVLSATQPSDQTVSWVDTGNSSMNASPIRHYINGAWTPVTEECDWWDAVGGVVSKGKPVAILFSGQSNVGTAVYFPLGESYTGDITVDKHITLWQPTTNEWKVYDNTSASAGNRTWSYPSGGGTLTATDNLWGPGLVNQLWMFSKLYSRTYGRSVRFVGTRRGGQPMAQWEATKLAWIELTSFATASGVPNFDAFIWIHGESGLDNVDNVSTFSTYKDSFYDFIFRLRSQSWANEKLKIIMPSHALNDLSAFTGAHNESVLSPNGDLGAEGTARSLDNLDSPYSGWASWAYAREAQQGGPDAYHLTTREHERQGAAIYTTYLSLPNYKRGDRLYRTFYTNASNRLTAVKAVLPNTNNFEFQFNGGDTQIGTIARSFSFTGGVGYIPDIQEVVSGLGANFAKWQINSSSTAPGTLEEKISVAYSGVTIPKLLNFTGSSTIGSDPVGGIVFQNGGGTSNDMWIARDGNNQHGLIYKGGQSGELEGSHSFYLGEGLATKLYWHPATGRPVRYDVFGELTSTISMVNTTTNDGVNKLQVNGSIGLRNPANTFSYILASSAIVANRTIALPLLTGNDVMVTADFIQTLTNKTITSSTNVLGGVTMTLGSDASYDMYYRNSSGIITRLPNGTTGQTITATTSAAPTWAAAVGITNTAVTDELMKSNGTNAVSSNLFVNATADLTMGTVSLANAERTFTASGSAANIGFRFYPKGSNGLVLNSGNITTSSGGIFATGGQLASTIDDANTSNPVNLLILTHTTTGTATNGIGNRITFASENSVGATITGGYYDLVATDVTSGSEDYDHVFKLMTNGAAVAEKFRIASTGDITSTGSINGTKIITSATGSSITGTTTNDAAAAGIIGEEINAIQSTYTNFTTTAAYQNITSIALTAGDWDLSAFFTYSSNSATITAASNAIFVISTTTASAAGAAEGLNIGYIPQAALLTTSKFSDTVTPYRVSLSGTTTYYLNAQATFTVGNPQFVGSIRARRIR